MVSASVCANQTSAPPSASSTPAARAAPTLRTVTVRVSTPSGTCSPVPSVQVSSTTRTVTGTSTSAAAASTESTHARMPSRSSWAGMTTTTRVTGFPGLPAMEMNILHLRTALRQLHRRAGRGDHEHAVVGAEDLVVDVDAHDGVGAEGLGALVKLGERGFAGVAEFLLICVGAAADDVAEAGADVLEHVDAGYGLRGHDADVVGDFTPFDAGGGRHDHAPRV